MTATTNTDPLDVERQAQAAKRHAQETGDEAASRLRGIQRDIATLTAKRQATLDREAAGEGVPGELKRATTALSTARQAEAEAEERGESARRAVKEAEGRLRGLRLTAVDELAVTAQPHVGEVERVQRELEPLLAAYREAWNQASRRYKQLADGTVQKVVTAHREIGFDPSDSTVRRESGIPACPLDAETVAAVLKLSPTPVALQPNYHPGMTPPEITVADEEREPVLFHGDDGWQQNAGANDGGSGTDAELLFPGSRGHQVHT